MPIFFPQFKHNILPCLGVVVGSELLAVVAPAHQVALAAGVTVILTYTTGYSIINRIQYYQPDIVLFLPPSPGPSQSPSPSSHGFCGVQLV